MNNLQWGLDHRIYGAGSSNGGRVRRADRAGAGAATVDLLRRDFRFDPAAGEFEAISGGARFGNTFDDWGNRFVCDIRNPAQHVVLPAHYLVRNPFLPTPRALHDAAEFGDAIKLFRISPPEPWRELRARRWAAVGKAMPRSELVGAGFLTSSSGLTVYRGDAYPAPYRGNLFLGEVANNLIHRMSRRARRRNLPRPQGRRGRRVRRLDRHLVPAGQLRQRTRRHADVLDMYRETIEHPWSIPDDIRAQLDLRSGADRGRIYRLTPPDFHRRPTPRLSRASTPELVGLLEHPNGWHRETAHRLLHERGDPAAVTPLKKPAPRGQGTARAAACPVCPGRPGALEAPDLRAALADDSPHVREHAVLLAEPLAGTIASTCEPTSRGWPMTRACASGSSSRSRSARSPATSRLDGLAAIARRDAADPWVRTAVLSSATADPAGLFERLWRRP